MKKNSKFTIETVKYYALKLRSTSQLPYKLVYYITQLTKDDSIEWVTYLKEQCELMLRVKGFYKRHPDVEKQFDQIVCDDYLKFKGYLK